MDKTKEFILQCEKAVEIQNLRGENLWEAGDFYTAYRHEKVYVWSGAGEDEPYASGNPIWLPTQSQLQEMVRQEFGCDSDTHLLYEFYEEWFIPNKIQSNSSMEQLWLSYVMFTNFGKTWSGTNWEVINGQAQNTTTEKE